MRAEMAKESRSSNIRNTLLSGLATALLFILGGPLLGGLGLCLTAFFGGRAVVDHLDARRYEYGTDQQRQSRANAAQNLQTYEAKERELQNDMQNEYAAMIEKAEKAEKAQEPVRERVNIQEMRGEENHRVVDREAARQEPVQQMHGGGLVQ